VTVKPLAEKAIAAVREGRIRLHPKTWENTYYDWMNNIRDWCISRQIWWGHQIPAWTCADCGMLIVADDDPTSCPACGSATLQREHDVLDTWFSSALWPFSTLGWPDTTKELSLFYPTSVLITSFDILFFWVARMIMMGIHFMDDIPFRDVYLHALVRDKHGQKMSKSKGNVMDPLVVMDQYGTDAFRFTLTAFAAQGREIRISEERIEGYRHFINKIWNASRFALMHLDEQAVDASQPDAGPLSLPDRWILSRASRTVRQVTAALDQYNFNEAASAIYQFVWHEFCDWYLEWVKPALYGTDESAKASTRKVLLATLDTILKLLHPIAPFVTEEIWHALPGERTSLMTGPFPEPMPHFESSETEAAAACLMGIVGGIRNIRSELQVHPSAEVSVILVATDPARRNLLESHRASITTLVRIKELAIEASGTCPKGAASFISEDVQIFVPLHGLVDLDKELQKLAKEAAKTTEVLARAEAKLGNEKFLSQAPAEVVAKEREKCDGLRDTIATIEATMARLRELAAS